MKSKQSMKAKKQARKQATKAKRASRDSGVVSGLGSKTRHTASSSGYKPPKTTQPWKSATSSPGYGSPEISQSLKSVGHSSRIKGISDTVEQAGGIGSYKEQLSVKYPHLDKAGIDNLVGHQLVREGHISAYDYADMGLESSPGVTREGFDFATNVYWRSKGYQPEQTESERVAAFNYATGVDNATSRAYQAALASDIAAGLNPPDHSAGYTDAPRGYIPGTDISHYVPESWTIGGVLLQDPSGGGLKELKDWDKGVPHPPAHKSARVAPSVVSLV